MGDHILMFSRCHCQCFAGTAEDQDPIPGRILFFGQLGQGSKVNRLIGVERGDEGRP